MPFGNKSGQDKLYKQWVSHGDITPETRKTREQPKKRNTDDEAFWDVEASENKRSERIERFQDTDVMPREKVRTKRSPTSLYILLAVSITLVCVGLVLIFNIF